ncbi:uncharacterized protein NPIL_369761 [Nephila pilipes]|uniref:Uncharacterized protein n=1 Tax=Nephila pilipes TaxID=299642 RepID=A0A8X6QT78_NEPPI|nr:uncharacterized protein NPIL_369761 [Nephila pilipes]
MLPVISILLIGILLPFSPVLTDMPLEFESVIHDHDKDGMQTLKIPNISGEEEGQEQMFSSEDKFTQEAMQQSLRRNLDENGVFPSALKGTFHRIRKSEKKECHILIQKTDVHKGSCTKLADNTPACHNDQYLAINYNEC